MADSREISILVADGEAGKRLDVVIADHIPSCSRSYAAALISGNHALVGQNPSKPAYRVKRGDAIAVSIPPPQSVETQPEAIAIDVLYEDEVVIVLNKPAGMPVHPSPGHATGTLVNGLLYHCPDLGDIGGEIRPGIVHRLDKDTSGVMVVAKSALSLNHLASQFKLHKVEKTYTAIVYGDVPAQRGIIDLAIGRHPIDRKRMRAIDQTKAASAGKGKIRDAVTQWRVVDRFSAATVLALYPKTGRTHQLRVHCTAIGHPIVGDPTYGSYKAPMQPASQRSMHEKLGKVKRQMLHARRLRFTHPATAKRLTFEVPFPSDMARLIDELRTDAAGLPKTLSGK